MIFEMIVLAFTPRSLRNIAPQTLSKLENSMLTLVYQVSPLGLQQK